MIHSQPLIREIAESTQRKLAQAVVPASALRRIMGLPLYETPAPVAETRNPFVDRPPMVRRIAKIKCANCGTLFERVYQRIYCGYHCQRAACRKARRGRPPRPDAPREAIQHIQWIVCEVWRITPYDLTGLSRIREHTAPRYAAMNLCREYLKCSTTSVAQPFGNRDHTTVLNATWRCRQWLASKTPECVRFAALYATAESRVRAALEGGT